MPPMKRTRRSFLAAAAAAPLIVRAGMALGADARDGSTPLEAVKKMDPKAFYKADGSFDAEATKKAYYEMMAAFGYPIPERLKTEDFWVCDFLQGAMDKVGMGGIFWVNESGQYDQTGAKVYKGDFKDQKFGYLGHEIYLLPGQVLPEHHHIGGEKGYGPKMEAWHIRYGTVTFFGEYKGAGDEAEIEKMAADEKPWGCGQDWFKSKFFAKRTAGQMYKLVDPESWHFQRAGAQGAIVSEYATFHNHVSFSKPGMEFACTKAKA
jgi:hypothetical protein